VRSRTDRPLKNALSAKPQFARHELPWSEATTFTLAIDISPLVDPFE
jgi:hypothetical protein